MADEQDVKIAVLETKFDGLREQHKAQTDKIVAMLERQNKDAVEENKALKDYIKPAVEFATVNKDMPAQVKVLWDFHQQNKGFLSAARLMTAAIGGVIVAFCDWFLRK